MRTEGRTGRGWLVAAAIVAASGVMAAAPPQQAQPPAPPAPPAPAEASDQAPAEALAPPPLLAGLRTAKAEWRLLNPATDLVGDYTIKQLEDLDRWPPWMEMDFDHDGKDDIAAVLVRKGSGGTEYTVAVVHGARPAQAELVVPFSPQRIFGVAEGIKDDTITPLRCADCEDNIWYRWNGRAYEPFLFQVGESFHIGGEEGKRSPVFASPRADSPRSDEVPYCAKAQVQEIGGDEGKRWYRVEVVAPSFPKGWVPQQLVIAGAECGR
jgi:hypothetical protein